MSLNPVNVIRVWKALPSTSVSVDARAIAIEKTKVRIAFQSSITIEELLPILAESDAAIDDVFALRETLECQGPTSRPQVQLIEIRFCSTQ